MIWKDSYIKGYSRVQGCVTLSSCESEVIAMCQLAQECVGLRHVCEFLEHFADPSELKKFIDPHLASLKFDQVGSTGDRESYAILLFSDSTSELSCRIAIRA